MPPCRPMSATWYWAHALGQPFRLMRSDPATSPTRFSRCSISSRARSLVSTIASLQNSMPVHEMTPRRKVEARVGRPTSASEADASSTSASGTPSTMTFWRLVQRSSPDPKRSAMSATAIICSPEKRPRRVVAPR